MELTRFFWRLGPRDRWLIGGLAVYLFIYTFAVPMLMLDLVPAWGRGMGGALLILQGGLVGGWLVRGAGWRGAVAAGCISAGGFVVEYVGVTTGWPFGPYQYTPVLGWQLAGAVPLAIPFAWLLVVPTSLAVARWLVGGWRCVALAAALALVLDLLIEPVAAYVVGYWQWEAPGRYYGVPTANFVAWATTALVLAALTWALVGRRWAQMPLAWLPPLLYGLNVLQFWLVDLAYGYWWAVALGAAVLGLLGWLVIRLTR